MRILTTAIAAVAATTIAAGVAVAAIPGPGGAVTACYTPDQGNGVGPLRPVDAATNCPGGDQRVTLGATGPAGPAGAAGTVGAVGERGAVGASAPAPQVFETLFAPDDPTINGRRNVTELPQTPKKAPISLDLPAGTFEVDAAADLSLYAYFGGRRGVPATPVVNGATCFLNSPGREAVSTATALAGASGTRVTDRAVIKLEAPTTIVFGCGADMAFLLSRRISRRVFAHDSAGGWVRHMRLTAIKVADGTAEVKTLGSIPGLPTKALKPSELPTAQAQSTATSEATATETLSKILSEVKKR